MERKNVNRGYRKLRVWEDAIQYYVTSESVSGLHAFRAAAQITDGDFDRLDTLVFRLENGLKRLIESLQEKKLNGSWDDTFVIRETNLRYTVKNLRPIESQSKKEAKRR